MSSGESRTTSSSRLSQFGLYRSIDARTEEFLRLSRKRQIRQGCACAAVSTAITVTIVVTILLVYEYNVSTETNLDQQSNKKPNWISLFNDSAPFDAKYNKAKLNLDPTTIKLLPIILKALKNNRYLEKLIEDSSSSPVYERKDTTEFAYKKNVFSDSKNWIKNPGAKTYEIDYKTSPIDYLKLPSSNLDYYRKIRKIRDYQRILNYFDKMVGEKVNSGATRPVHVVTQMDSKPSRRTLPTKTPKQADITTKQKKQVNTTVTDYANTTVTKSEICKCPTKLSLLLSKLLSNIQELIPEIMIAKLPCIEKRHNNINMNDNTIRSTALKTLGTRKSKIFNPTAKLTTATKKMSTTTMKHTKSNNDDKTNIVPGKTFEPDSSDIKDDSLELDITRKFYKNYILPATTTSKGYLEATKALFTKEAITVPMRKNTQTIIINQISAENDDIAEEHTTGNYDIQKSMTTPNYKDEYNDYGTTTNDEYNNNKLNEIRLPGLKRNTEIFSKIIRKKQIPVKTVNFVQITTKATGPELLNFNKIRISTISSSPKRQETTVTASSTTATKPSTTSSYLEYKSSTTARNYSKENITTKRSKDITSLPAQNTSMPEHFNDDEENGPAENDIQEEESMKQIDTLNKNIRPGLKWYDKNKNENYSSLQYEPVTIKTTDSSNVLLRFEEIKPRRLKSMLPESRPIYLEIYRHDSKQDTADDYNGNPMDQNIFDLY